MNVRVWSGSELNQFKNFDVPGIFDICCIEIRAIIIIYVFFCCCCFKLAR